MTIEKAIEVLKNECYVFNPMNFDRTTLINTALDTVIETLEQEPKKGHWITRPHVYGATYCSECDFELKIDDTNYCPNCGAKMESEERRTKMQEKKRGAGK